jgi:hypothetical protein
MARSSKLAAIAGVAPLLQKYDVRLRYAAENQSAGASWRQIFQLLPWEALRRRLEAVVDRPAAE